MRISRFSPGLWSLLIGLGVVLVFALVIVLVSNSQTPAGISAQATVSLPSPTPTATVLVLPTATASAAPLLCGTRTLAYLDGLRIVLVDTTGKTLKLLEDRDELISFEEPFQWSPDSSSIAYQRYVPSGGPAWLKVIDVETGIVKQLTQGSAFEFAWSHDGSRLSFNLIGNSVFAYLADDDGLYVATADGGALNLLIKRINEQDGYMVFADNPRWSPTTNTIAYFQSVHVYREGNANIPSSGITLIDPEAPQPKTILNITTTLDIRWSPDGSQIAFTTNASRLIKEKGDIFLINIDGSDLRNLTNQPGYYSVPSWSPDGEWLLYAYSPTHLEEMHIYVMRTDGSERRQISRSLLFDPRPTWSPDGKCIGFLGSSLFVMNADGSNPISLTDDYRPQWFQWRP